MKIHVAVVPSLEFLNWNRMSDKQAILEELDTIIVPAQRMGIGFLITVLILVILFLMAVFPKIYLQNQIYYKSREIAKSHREYDALLEENRIIKSKVERIRFKNQILDTIF